MAFFVTIGAGPSMGPVDSDGDRFVITDLPGWEGADIETVMSDRYPHGAFLGRVRMAPRNITVAGTAFSANPTIDTVWRLRKKISQQAAQALNGLVTFSVSEPTEGASTQCAVRAAGQPRVRPRGPLAVDFEIPLIAPDPRKYGTFLKTAALSASTTAVPNLGDLPSPPKATVTSTAGGLMFIRNYTRNQWVSFSTPPPVGSVVDVQARTVVGPGPGFANLYGTVTTDSNWPEVQPGSDLWDSVGGWVLSWRDAWL